MKLKDLLKASGFAAVSAALALTAVPAAVSAQDNARSWGNRGGNAASNADRRADRPSEARPARVERQTTNRPARAESDGNRRAAQEALRQLAEGIAGAHAMEAEVTFIEGFPPTINDARAIDLGEKAAHELAGPGAFLRMEHPIMGAEDFSYILQKIPGAMYFLGVAAEGEDWRQCCGLHSSRMMVDEAVLPRGAAFLAACAARYLAKGWD